jgi:hypothetical protein
MRCITSARFNMTATVLTQDELVIDSTNPDGSVVGHWENKQDPETGEIVRVWVVEDTDPVTPGVQEKKVKCIVRGILDGGIRVAGTTERYTPQGILESVDFVKMQFPASVIITKRDRVTNIANRKGIIIWREEEFDNAPTVFDVQGVTPVVDPFGTLVEWTALLQRSEVQ